MKLRFISSTNHGIIDYSAAAALITAPFLLNLGGSSALISVVTGIAVILVSILTNYKYSLLKAIPFDLHLAIDLTVATAFIIIPFVFGFSGLSLIYFIANAAIVYLVVAFSASNVPCK